MQHAYQAGAEGGGTQVGWSQMQQGAVLIPGRQEEGSCGAGVVPQGGAAGEHQSLDADSSAACALLLGRSHG